MANRPILVIGATGQQGGAVARELLRGGHEVRALTRSPGSAAAQALARRGARLAEGDLDDAELISSAMAGAAAVFSVQTFMGPEGVTGEVSRGKRVAEAAAAVGVGHLVYSSVDGAERQSGVPHFESKWQIEQHLRMLGVPATVLRPTTFMDNFATVQRPQTVDGELLVRLAVRPTKPLQMVATADIGVFAADAFERPEQHIGKAIALAGDELTGPQIAQVFRETLAMPARYEQQPLDEIRGFSEDLALMSEWLNDFGYQADIPALRRRHPELRRLRDWLTQTAWQPSMPA
ncbi:NmrA/HSCARG family protein [Agromyces bauzanensis]|uniref:NmrA family transcriptional regulator n=1 Tax=Agromyces bauzanensis TaxID=1308924 RepID=A0A917PQX9_9MICO|nr:NmrA/HSCARG family protein [Agromyces bauzanensis]GGJ88629.1 NmrA family transcriptional regulator [Agromyces bauzanensis]